MEPSTFEFIKLTGEMRALLGKAGRVATLVFKADLSQRPWRPSFAESRVHHQEIVGLVSKGLLHEEKEGQFQLKRENVIVQALDRHTAQLRGLLTDPKNAHVVEELGAKNRASMSLGEPAFFAKFLDPFVLKSVPEPKGRRPMCKNRENLRLGMEFKGTCIFVSVPDLKKIDPTATPQVLQRLHESIVELDVYVLASIIGLILVSPDGDGSSLDEIMGVLATIKGIPLAIRVGVTHGDVEVVRDVDGEYNLISPCINIGARLAFSSVNEGALIHESYVHMYGDSVRKGHCLSADNRDTIVVEGKAHDAEMSACRWEERFEPDFAASLTAVFPTSPAILLAYDLSGFSKGDRSQLSKRFNAVTQMFDRIQSILPMKEAASFLSPGGDGGILVITRMNPNDIVHVPERLRELGAIASIDMGSAVSPRVRVGVHYGVVTFYKTADGTERPSGRALLVADAVAGDDLARAYDGVIMTAEVADALVAGSRDRLKEMFDEIPESDDVVLKGVRRFVRRP